MTRIESIIENLQTEEDFKLAVQNGKEPVCRFSNGVVSNLVQDQNGELIALDLKFSSKIFVDFLNFLRF